MAGTTRVAGIIAKADELGRGGEWGAAFQSLQEACQIAPNDPAVIVRLGRYQLLIGFPADGWLPMFERAARLSSFSSEAQTELALAYAVAGKLADASGTLECVLKKKGPPPLAAHLLALLYGQDLRHGEAKDILRSASRAFPADVVTWTLLAQYYELESDYAAARVCLEKVFDCDTENAPARLALARIDHWSAQGWSVPEISRRGNPHSVDMLVDDRKIDRRVLDEAMSLQNAGWDVVVVAGESPLENPFWDEECYPDLRIMRMNGRAFTIVSPCGAYRYSVPYCRTKAGRHIRNDSIAKVLPAKEWHALFHQLRGYYIAAVDLPAAVYVAHDLPQLPAAAMAALHHGAYLVYDSHELFPEQSFVRKDRPVLSAMEAHLAPLADRIVVVNESMVQEMTTRYGVNSEVILNCPAVNVTKFPLERTNRIRESLAIPESRRILLYQGNIVSRIRNLETMIEAMALLRRDDVALVLMGPDSGGGADLVALAEERGLLGRSVYFHPSVRQSELLSYTVSADAGLIPYTPVDWNTKYCTPNKLYEFIVSGLPILANTLPELIRFVSGLEIGVNSPMGTPLEAAQAIDRFFDSDVEGFRLRLREISPRFIWQNHEGVRIVEIYESMLNAPSHAEQTETAKESQCAA